MGHFDQRLGQGRLNIAVAVFSALLISGCAPGGKNASFAADTTTTRREDLSSIGTLPQAVPAEQLSKTDVRPHLEGPIIAERNYVYCATFKMAWDKLVAAGAEPAHVKEPAVAAALKRVAFSEADLSSDAYVSAYGGSGEIKAAMQDKFPQASIPLPRTSGAVAFSYLKKSLPFRERFQRLETPLEFQGENQSGAVASFGMKEFEESSTRASLQKNQISIIDYRSDDDFVIRLNTTSKVDRLILAKTSPKATLSETVAAVQARERKAYAPKSEESQLQDGESFIVPIVSVGVVRQFSELLPANGAADGDASSVQVIRFRLDEEGARLESQVDYSSLGGAAPRRFIFDRPFLIYLHEEKSEHPYFVAWIANAELLEQWKGEKPKR